MVVPKHWSANMKQTSHEAPRPPESSPLGTADTAELHPNTSSEVILDPTQDTFAQLQRDAAERGRPDMVGLAWTEGDLYYRVSSYDRLPPQREQVLEAALAKRAVEKVVKSVTYGPEEPTPTRGVTEYRTIDVYNANGDLVNVLPFAGKERRPIERHRVFDGKHQLRLEKLFKVPQTELIDRFGDYFRVNSRANPNAKGASTTKGRIPRQISNVHWTDQGSENVAGTGERRVVPVPKVEAKVLLYALAKQQKDLGLESWQGLTWTDEQGNKKKILSDRVAIKKDERRRDDVPTRLFEVITFGVDNRVVQRHTYTAESLEHHFVSRSKVHPNAPDVNLQWEITKYKQPGQNMPQDPLARAKWHEEEAWSNWAEPNKPELAKKRTAVSLDEAFILLSSPELAGDHIKLSDIAARSEVQAQLTELKKKAETTKQAEALQKILSELGLEEFQTRISKLHEGYVTDMRRVGIMVPDTERRNAGWLVKDLVESYLKDNERLFEDSEVGTKLQNQVVDLKRGQTMYQVFIVKKEAHKEDIDEKGHSIKRLIEAYGENPAVVGKLRKLLYGENIDTLLKKRATNEDPELTSKEFMHIGQLLRLSFGRI
jgi:hypothetical protein